MGHRGDEGLLPPLVCSMTEILLSSCRDYSFLERERRRFYFGKCAGVYFFRYGSCSGLRFIPLPTCSSLAEPSDITL